LVTLIPIEFATFLAFVNASLTLALNALRLICSARDLDNFIAALALMLLLFTGLLDLLLTFSGGSGS
jgi:hypothetical protein